MIHYVISSNPDDRVLSQAKKAIENDQLICFPTDTCWLLAAAPVSKKAYEKLCALKLEDDHHSRPSLLCSNLSMASQFVQIDNSQFKLAKRCFPGPFTFIFSVRNDAPRLVKLSREDHKLGIRIPQDPFCLTLLDKLETPLLTVALNKVMLEKHTHDEEMRPLLREEIYSYQIEEAYRNQIGLIIDPGDYAFSGHTTIVDISDGVDSLKLLRPGLGLLPSEFQKLIQE